MEKAKMYFEVKFTKRTDVLNFISILDKVHFGYKNNQRGKCFKKGLVLFYNTKNENNVNRRKSIKYVIQIFTHKLHDFVEWKIIL